MYIDVGAPGGGNDAGVMQGSTLQAALDNGSLNLPSMPHSIGIIIDTICLEIMHLASTLGL